ncbi:3-deoxy-manno-octulosonate cytidylyltransferase (CMP-KDO synthetase) [Flaviramulus basaltis]|uniref:3-deoxy-manno-octulosonate cytidylyltransferase (CMP-KDO synthetase) n=1 Tax=Flaviramulus basaltis TaxID=369401 RepID=A0A1K2ICW3_9FLAO|nr:3-deoxy-manno-octulosonate cytidylyltransferase [Flaviramulus basaltis]SFZ90128.1 3-deoxy-manno-octulosonate cytidylyltransferase (CMP-KDO synthetase) [Flaviramulus basaltis]
MRKIGIIPARYKSSRFPGKPLVKIAGIPMIIRVAEIVSEALGKENTYVATEDDRIKEVVEKHGFNVIMTSESCLTGTDRVWEVAQKIDADVYLNIQGDEPLLNPLDILKIAKEKENFPNYVINGMIDIGPDEDPNNINLPKVLVNNKNELIYMSRLPIPGIKDLSKGRPIYKKQVCIYAFNYEELKSFGESSEKAAYENYEDIEILRFFDFLIPIKMVETSSSSLAVDVFEDVKKVEMAILK